MSGKYLIRDTRGLDDPSDWRYYGPFEEYRHATIWIDANKARHAEIIMLEYTNIVGHDNTCLIFFKDNKTHPRLTEIFKVLQQDEDLKSKKLKVIMEEHKSNEDYYFPLGALLDSDHYIWLDDDTEVLGGHLYECTEESLTVEKIKSWTLTKLAGN